MLLVTAGYNDEYVRSTELLVTGTSSWTLAADYPLPVTGLSGASINNTVLMTGGETWQWSDETEWIVPGGGDVAETRVDSVYRYEDGGWNIAGRMKTAREEHSVSVLKVQDLDVLCVWRTKIF